MSGHSFVHDEYLYTADAIAAGIERFGAKTCKRCGRELPATRAYFRPQHSARIGALGPLCRPCYRERDRLRKHEHPQVAVSKTPASGICTACWDYPDRCKETFVCDLCGRHLRTCEYRAGGFDGDDRDICTRCLTLEQIRTGRLAPDWSLTVPGRSTRERAELAVAVEHMAEIASLCTHRHTQDCADCPDYSEPSKCLYRRAARRYARYPRDFEKWLAKAKQAASERMVV